MSPTPIRILIVDDHPIVREGYSQLIGNQPDLEVCGVADSEAEALRQAKSAQPHAAIIDITLKHSNGIELVKTICERHPQIKILVVSAHDENLYAERALEAGAYGYVNKQEATGKLIEGIRKVLRGEVYVSDHITDRMLRRRVARRNHCDEAPAIESLTDRELQVYEMIGNGQTTKQIAAALHLSAKTIERYKENIKGKLKIDNATQLVQQATRWVIEKG